MRPTSALRLQPSRALRWGFVFRENRVPHYQRLFQKNDGVRQWWKTPNSKYYLYPYFTLMYGTCGASLYMMVRMVLGHKTWFGKG